MSENRTQPDTSVDKKHKGAAIAIVLPALFAIVLVMLLAMLVLFPF